MIKSLKKSKSFWIYFSTTLLNQLIPFLILPILTHYLSVKDYGTLTLFQTILAFIMPIISMSLSRQLDKYFFQQEKTFIASLIFQIFVIFHLMTLMIMLLLPIIDSLFHIEFSIIWLYLLVSIALSNSINLILSILFRNLNYVYFYGAFQIFRTVINVGLSLLLIVYFDYGYEGRFIGIMVSSYIGSIIALYFLYKYNWISFRIDFTLLKKIWKISLPMIPFGLATIIITMSDIFFIKEMCSVEIVGLYSIGLMFGKTIVLIQGSVTNVSEPWVLRQLSQKNDHSKVKIVKFIWLYHLGMIFLVLIGTYFSYLAIDMMVDQKFHGGKEFVPIIMLAYMIRGLQHMFLPILIYKDKTNFMAMNTFFSALINIFLNYFLILYYGAIGAAYATLITFLISYCVVFFYSQRIFPLPLWSFRDE